MAADMQRLVVRVGLRGDKDKIKAMKAVGSIENVDSVSADMKDMKLTVIGIFDPVAVVSKLRKHWHTNIVLISLANEPGRGRMNQRRERRRRKELLMNRSPSLRRHNKNIRGLILLISQSKITDNSLDTV
ncbi:heavy metal-associated isoprenylated plant protein 39-like [Musa acuminata AAA Group]|uniref:heavy metal-associated isoprenylated plant protein 39-like n=1 Tax=Musa acuminata AAA Group TaxID=214697 RepID=UPI0031D54858